MDLIADILLIAGAVGAAFYCIVLSRRLSRFNDLEKGVGGAIAVLSAQVDDMTKTLAQAQSSANGSNKSLMTLTSRAEDVAKRLELMVAAMHDIPETNTETKEDPPEPDVVSFSHHPASSKQNPEEEMLFRSQRKYAPEAAE